MWLLGAPEWDWGCWRRLGEVGLLVNAALVDNGLLVDVEMDSLSSGVEVLVVCIGPMPDTISAGPRSSVGSPLPAQALMSKLCGIYGAARVCAKGRVSRLTSSLGLPDVLTWVRSHMHSR